MLGIDFSHLKDFESTVGIDTFQNLIFLYNKSDSTIQELINKINVDNFTRFIGSDIHKRIKKDLDDSVFSDIKERLESLNNDIFEEIKKFLLDILFDENSSSTLENFLKNDKETIHLVGISKASLKEPPPPNPDDIPPPLYEKFKKIIKVLEDK